MSTTLLKENPERLNTLKESVSSFPISICIERAVLITDYFKNKTNRKKPMAIQMAEALSHIFVNKSVKIYPVELIVGSTTSKRVAGPLYPELHGLPVLEDIFIFTKRKVNPLQITGLERTTLIKKVVPFWLTKFLAYKSLSTIEFIRFIGDQLTAKFYLINESGGIGHFIPDYETLINIGLDGIAEKIREKQAQIDDDTKNSFYKSLLIICDGVIKMAENYSKEASRLADEEKDLNRKRELLMIAENTRRVPKKGAQTFFEALQSIWLVHTAITLEGLDNGISFGRMDQYLYPFYERDINKGLITPSMAKELLGCFAIKSAEIIPVFSNKITNYHGGLLSGQALTIGGIDKDDNDVTNDLSYLFLDIMNNVRMRQPNYHARIHQGSPEKYIKKIMSNLLKGANTPALYNDDIIIRSMKMCGYSSDDSKEYGTVGCVELNPPGKTFASTDAALFNIPICLELALNRGKLFGSRSLKGYKTPNPETFENIDDVKSAFTDQLQFMISKLVNALAPIERGNNRFHPTPLTSAMIRGCIQKGIDVTEGGAIYNFSGVQGVGMIDTGDSIYALDQLVFEKKKYTMKRVINALKNNFKGEKKMHAEFLNCGKFGNDNTEVDDFSRWVINAFYDSFEGKINTRGGKFIAGFYSTTTHLSFGSVTGALPSGRQKGKPFSSGISPMNGFDKKGPTALFNSITRLDILRAHNGVNVNAKFDTATLKGDHGCEILEYLILTYFKKGGMQVQLNVLDTEMLKEAKANPDKYPGLIVRISGYSAYFNDLSPAMKDEIIQRSCLS